MYVISSTFCFFGIQILFHNWFRVVDGVQIGWEIFSFFSCLFGFFFSGHCLISFPKKNSPFFSQHSLHYYVVFLFIESKRKEMIITLALNLFHSFFFCFYACCCLFIDLTWSNVKREKKAINYVKYL